MYRAVPGHRAFEVLKADRYPFFSRRRRQMFAGIEIMPDLAEDPGIADRGAADHDAVDAKTVPVLRGFFGAVDVAVAKDRDMDAGIFLYPADKGPVRLALVELAPGSAMDRQGPDARVLKSLGDRLDILVVRSSQPSRVLTVTGSAGSLDAGRCQPDHPVGVL